MAERLAMLEKPFANPAKVGLLLVFEAVLGIDPGVDEDIVARHDDIFHLREELAMFRGHEFVELGLQFLHGELVVALFLDAVAEHGLAPAMLEEMPEHFLVFEALEEHFLVIAGDIADRAVVAPLACGFDHARAFGTAIDQIAQHNDRTARVAGLPIVVFDGEDQFVEQVAAAVDITDDVEALALRDPWKGLGRRALVEQFCEFQHVRIVRLRAWFWFEADQIGASCGGSNKCACTATVAVARKAQLLLRMRKPRG